MKCSNRSGEWRLWACVALFGALGIVGLSPLVHAAPVPQPKRVTCEYCDCSVVFSFGVQNAPAAPGGIPPAAVYHSFATKDGAVFTDCSNGIEGMSVCMGDRTVDTENLLYLYTWNSGDGRCSSAVTVDDIQPGYLLVRFIAWGLDDKVPGDPEFGTTKKTCSAPVFIYGGNDVP